MASRLVVFGLVCVFALSACGSQPANGDIADDAREDRELTPARAIATDAASAEEADVSSARFQVRNGTVTESESNVGHPCASGELIDVKLIGTFPHIVTTGHPLASGKDEDFTVTVLDITADAASGKVCLKSVQTGEVEPEPGAADIPLD